jgi:hypothetical protein
MGVLKELLAWLVATLLAGVVVDYLVKVVLLPAGHLR